MHTLVNNFSLLCVCIYMYMYVCSYSLWVFESEDDVVRGREGREGGGREEGEREGGRGGREGGRPKRRD